MTPVLELSCSLGAGASTSTSRPLGPVLGVFGPSGAGKPAARGSRGPASGPARFAARCSSTRLRDFCRRCTAAAWVSSSRTTGSAHPPSSKPRYGMGSGRPGPALDEDELLDLRPCSGIARGLFRGERRAPPSDGRCSLRRGCCCSTNRSPFDRGLRREILPTSARPPPSSSSRWSTSATNSTSSSASTATCCWWRRGAPWLAGRCTSSRRRSPERLHDEGLLFGFLAASRTTARKVWPVEPPAASGSRAAPSRGRAPGRGGGGAAPQPEDVISHARPSRAGCP